MSYQTLNDAASTNPILAKGSIKIWYYKKEWSRIFSFGPAYIEEQGIKFDTDGITRTHELLGEIKGGDHADAQAVLDEIWTAMQGENWSPCGEARNIIWPIGHTSMSVGDVIEMNGTLYMVDSFGFEIVKRV